MSGNFTTLCMKRLIVYDTSNYYIKGSSHWMKSVQIRSFLWFVFSCIRTEHGDLRSKSSYLVQIQKNTDQKKLHMDTLHAASTNNTKTSSTKINNHIKYCGTKAVKNDDIQN